MASDPSRAIPGPSVVVDGMRVDWDTPIVADDGVVLRADVFRPIDETPVPVLLTYGPYGKGMHFPEHHPEQWERLVERQPEVLVGSTNKYQAWETPDPERWVPHGYAYVRVDSRGAGRSEGFLSPNSPRETHDAAGCVEWAAAQPWSTGKVGMLGISYYACTSWRVAALDPPPAHLAAICAWEGNTEAYREASRHGGILTTWAKEWWRSRLLPMQHGYGERGGRNPNTGELAAGPETLTDDELRDNRARFAPERNPHVLYDDWWKERGVVLEDVRVPLLSAANWGGAALHLRGNVEGFVQASSEHKFLEVHGLEHWTLFCVRTVASSATGLSLPGAGAAQLGRGARRRGGIRLRVWRRVGGGDRRWMTSRCLGRERCSTRRSTRSRSGGTTGCRCGRWPGPSG